MSWLDRKDDYDTSGGRLRRPAPRRREERVYSVSDVARMLSVGRSTVYKWLSIESPEDAVISPSNWFRLPSGHIRIRETAVRQLLSEAGS